MEVIKPIVACLLAFLLIPALALSGTWGQTILGANEPEIIINTGVQSGSLTPGKLYYWADNDVSVEANTEGETVGANAIITADITSTLSMIISRSDWCTPQFCPGRNYYDPECTHIYFDKDAHFGNGNEFEFVPDVEGDEIIIAHDLEPLQPDEKIYLAIRPVDGACSWQFRTYVTAKVPGI